MKEKTSKFMQENGMSAKSVDFMSVFDSFVGEMDKGLETSSSIPMLPTYLSVSDTDYNNKNAIVIDAGGTNFRAAFISFDENKKAKVEGFTKHKMPGTSGPIESGQFFEEMAELVRPLINKSENIGFCFSYPLEMMPNKDGKLMKLTKELDVKGSTGLLAGECLLDALGVKGKKITLLNDTVASLLGGLAVYPDRTFSSYVGFILGTGSNSAYVEQCKNIKKSPAICAADGDMIINMESGSFSKAPRGYIDEMLDKSTVNPTLQTFEKMISGAYLGMNLFFALKVAAEKGVLSDKFRANLDKIQTITTVDMDTFFKYPMGGNVIADLCTSYDERLFAYYAAEEISERAAKLSAINLAATVKKSGAGTSPLEPVCIVAEGSTYYKAKFIRERIAYYLTRYLNGEMGLYADILACDDVTLLGSAVAGVI